MDEYGQIVERYDLAYEAHQAMYAKRNPTPQRQITQRDDKALFAAVILMVAASVIVSASHTLPVFMSPLADLPEVARFFVAIAAFCMMEAGLVSLAYVWVKSKYAENPDEQMRVGRWIRLALFLIFLVAVLSNVFHVVGKTFEDTDTPFWRGFMLVISVLIGVSAPVLAFISGEVLAMLTVTELQRQAAIERQYQAALDEWTAALNVSWERQKARLGVRIKVEADTPPDSRALSNGRPIGQASGQAWTRQADASQQVLDYLEVNPDALRLTVRQLAEQVGVSKSTAAAVKRQFK